MDRRVPFSPARERAEPAKKKQRLNGASAPKRHHDDREPKRDDSPERPSHNGKRVNSPDPLSIAEQLHAQSEQIGKAVSIVHVCHQACASLYRVDDEELMVPALVAVMDMLGAVMGRLEEIGGADAEIEA
jgi:hypothetical protein